MNKTFLLIAAAAALVTGAAFAGDITDEQARTVAENFVAKDSVGMRVLPDRAVDTVVKRGGFYLVTLKPSGHIFVSVNRSARPIPTFSETDFVEPVAGSPQAAFLAVAETNAINATGAQYETQWKTLLGQKALRLSTSSTMGYVNIDPMLKTAWTQNYPYNSLIPVVNRAHTLVGCVATAYSQVLRYWEWPEVLDEDVVSEHFVDSIWGHKWRLKAGTQFDWGKISYVDSYDNATLLRLGRATMFAGMLAHMKYNTAASGTQTAQPGKNRWYTEPRVLDTSNSTLAQREAGMKQSLQNGCPFMVSVNYGAIGHAVVGDGWQESSSGSFVHLNYGWGYDNSYYATSDPLGVYLDAKPRPMVMNKPLPTHASSPVKVEWSFPTKGYDDALTGFTVSYTEVEDTITDWTDDMSFGKGTIDGTCLSVEAVDETEHGKVMRIGTKADEAIYTWPTMVATKDTVFSYDIHSFNALGMVVEIQLLDPTVGWTTLAVPEIGQRSEIEWASHSIDLGGYAGRGIAIRVKATRDGDSSFNDDDHRSTGVQFDNIKLTNVRQAKTTVAATATAGKDARCLIVSESLVADKTYLFQVTPMFSDGTVGIPGYKASCTIVNDAVAKPAITSVTSVRSGAPAVKDSMCRECYFGLNQFGVYGSESVTKLEAYLSNLVVIGEVEEQDTTQPAGTMITTHNKVSIANAVSVEKKSPGNFLVKVNVPQLTDYLYGTGMILTLVARNEQGDVDRKDIFLEFTKTGSEQEIAVADLPESGGTVTPDEPDPVYHTVTFDSMGGSAVSSRSCKAGDAIGSLDTPTKDGCSFAGWYTDPMNGTRIYDNEPVTKAGTYYAHWTENSMSEDDPNPPAVTTCTVTFDPNGGAVTLERSVEKGGVIGALPEIVRDGYALDGWYTLAEGGTKVSALTTVDADITYYAHWNVSSGGGDEPGGGDPVDDGNTRFCHGVNKTSGWFDTKKPSDYNNYMEPIAVNLVKWWAEQYKAANGAYPTGYTVIPDSILDRACSDTIANLATALADNYLGSISDRATYFPAAMTAAGNWYASESTMAVEAGAKIYVALAKGPIGYKTTLGYGVIWGCDYATDGATGAKYATKVYVTDTRSRDNKFDSYDFRKCYDYSDYNTGTPMPGLYNFTPLQSLNAKIESYYPIVGPAGLGGGGDDEPTVKTFIVTFDSDGGSAVNAQSVEDGESLVSIPAPTKSGYAFAGWYDGETKLTTSTKITANVTFTAHWTAVVAPDDPTPDEPVVPADEVIGVADNSKDPGNDYTASYGYEMYDNYWTARKRAMQQGKQLFVLSGAAWCSNCAFVKSYLKTLGSGFSDKFVVYYSDNDSTVCNCFKGGLPQYGAADPRAVDAFTGTLNGSVRSWDIAWQTDTSGIYKQDRGGYAPERVEAVVTAGKLKAAYGYPTDLVIRGLSTLGTGKVGRYELFARYADGVEMPVDYGVEWKVVSGTGTVSDANVDGRDVAALTVASGSVVLQAKSTFYFSGSKSITVDCAPETDIESVEIITSEVNLEDNATPTIEAEATLKSGKKIPVFGFGTWEATFDHRIARADPELEENSDAALNPTITVDNESRLNYALSDGLLAVCDQVVNLKLTVNGKSHTKQVTVWGPTKVFPSEWTVVSAATQTTPGVVRLSCTKLKYNYGGEIKTTSDSYFASYEIVLKNGIYSQVSHLRGLTVYVNDPNANRDYKVSLRAKKVNGKYTGYLPAIPNESPSAPTVTCLARGAERTALDKGLVPNGFFQAFFPGRTDYEALAEEDADGDGFKNWEEYVLGTDPTNKSDAFTLMQGYQHLTAPAANGATMQYKVMYQQRAGRIYYIDGKKSWGDDWAQVASVKLADMKETDVTTFAYPTADSAAFADGCSFFRVRAAMCEHEFNYPDTMPIIAPNMLVAAPGAIIDLSDGSRLDLSSFDTDATDPGTVWVKVAANVAPGTTLIRAPKTAEKSLKACKPHGRTDIMFEVAEESGKLALKVAGVPAVEDDKGNVTVEGDKIVIVPNEGVTEIALSNVGEKQVAIPSSVEKIVGVTDSKKLIVKSGTHDVTKAMKFAQENGGIRIELDEAAVVKVGNEEIPVLPTLADGDNEAPFELSGGNLVFKVKSIPGLTYQVLVSDSLELHGFGPVAGSQKAASSARSELTVERPSNASRGFYKIRVSR